MDKPDIPINWLSKIPGFTDSGFTAQKLQGGYMSDVWRLSATLEPGSTVDPPSVILKQAASTPEASELAFRYRSAAKELAFYNHQLRNPGEFQQRPDCFAADAKHGILIADLGVIDSVQPLNDHELISQAIRTMGQLPLISVSADAFNISFETASVDMSGFVTDFLHSQPDDPEVNLLRHYAKYSAKFLNRFLNLPQVFSHMDFRVGNFTYDNGNCVLIDWGEYSMAPVGCDLALFLVTSMDTSLRRQLEADLLVQYQSELVRHGSTVHLDTLFNGYRLCLPLTTYLPALMASRGDYDIAAPVFERCAAAVEDHLDFLHAVFLES